MCDEDVLRRLTSQDNDDVLDALAAIGAERKRSPSLDVVRECVRLFAHDDADVRHDAIAAIALHWGHRDSTGALVSLLTREQDEYVLVAATRGLGRVARDNLDLVPVAGAALARLALANDRTLKLRKLAYVEARSLFEQADAAARVAVALESTSTELDIDIDWLLRLTDPARTR